MMNDAGIHRIIQQCQQEQEQEQNILPSVGVVICACLKLIFFFHDLSDNNYS
jgi:hypothetical protein